MARMNPPAVTLDLPYQEEHSRLTTFFRYPLALLPLLWLNVIAVVACCGTVIAWFALLVTGQYPASLYGLNRTLVRYNAKVNAYLMLETDRFPGFSADDPADYPAELHIGEPLPAYDRIKVLLRIFLVIPPFLISYAMNIVAWVGAVLAWFAIVFTGRLPRGIHGITRLGLSYSFRMLPYALLMTETWPEFTQDGDIDALREPGSAGALASSAGVSAATDAFGQPAMAPPPELPGGFEPPQPPAG